MVLRSMQVSVRCATKLVRRSPLHSCRAPIPGSDLRCQSVAVEPEVQVGAGCNAPAGTAQRDLYAVNLQPSYAIIPAQFAFRGTVPGNAGWRRVSLMTPARRLWNNQPAAFHIHAVRLAQRVSPASWLQRCLVWLSCGSGDIMG